MAVFKKQELLSELTDRTEVVISSTKSFLKYSEEKLNFKPAPEKWSIAEVFDHLYKTHQIYIQHIIPVITQREDISQTVYKSGWLGDFFYNKIMPRPDGTVFKMKTPTMLRPSIGTLNGNEIVERFLQQQGSIHDIIEHSAKKDLRKIRIQIAVTKLIKIQLGDVLRLIVAHNERHLFQAKMLAENFTLSVS